MNKVAQRPSPPVSGTDVGAAFTSTSVTRGLTYYKAFNFSTGLLGDIPPFHLKGADKWSEKDFLKLLTSISEHFSSESEVLTGM